MSIFRLILIVLVVLAVAGSGYGGYWYGLRQAVQQTDNPQSSSTSLAKPPASNSTLGSLIKGQQAILEGVVVKKDSQSITLRSADKKEVSFQFSPSLIIYPAPEKANLPSRATSDTTAIQTGKNALITLEPQGESYLVKTISYDISTSSASKR